MRERPAIVEVAWAGPALGGRVVNEDECLAAQHDAPQHVVHRGIQELPDAFREIVDRFARATLGRGRRAVT